MSNLQQDLAKVGIRVKIEPQDEAVLLAAYRAQKVAFILFEWGVDYPDSGDFAMSSLLWVFNAGRIQL